MLSPEEKLSRKKARQLSHAQAKENTRIDSLKNQKPVRSLVISIEWRKSRMWGTNPHASVAIYYHDGLYTSQDGFTCGGCGYDKESTVIAEIFNQFLAYKLFQHVKKTRQKWVNNDGKKPLNYPYGISIRKYKAGENLDGIMYPEIDSRYFSDAIGTDCYYAIARAIGGTFEHTASGKSFDVFTYTDRVKK